MIRNKVDRGWLPSAYGMIRNRVDRGWLPSAYGMIRNKHQVSVEKH
jgi:hypothetical protein